MTTTTEVSCPKCHGAMWDQKNGKFPWKPGTPIFKCKTKECAAAGGVYWENNAPTGTPAANEETGAPPKPAEAKTVEPEKTEGGDTALSAEAWAFLGRVKEITAWYMAEITPLYVEAKVGCSPESCQAGIATILIQLNGRGGR